MLRLTRPSATDIEALLSRSAGADPTYPEVGATRNAQLPAGYRHDSYETELGLGGETFARGSDALRRWQAHKGAGAIVVPDELVVDGGTVILLLRTLGLWAVAPCRVVYVVEEAEKFGFAYATLPGHPERGEASFVVSLDEDDVARFRIRSFSRSVDPLARAAQPLTRRVQRRVTLRYLAALSRAAQPG